MNRGYRMSTQKKTAVNGKGDRNRSATHAYRDGHEEINWASKKKKISDLRELIDTIDILGAGLMASAELSDEEIQAMSLERWYGYIEQFKEFRLSKKN
jgi:hypothetical protein